MKQPGTLEPLPWTLPSACAPSGSTRRFCGSLPQQPPTVLQSCHTRACGRGHQCEEAGEGHTVPLFKWIVRGGGQNARHLRGWLVCHLFNTPHEDDVAEV